MNIVLTGFMATGKTEISKAISEISKYNLVDTDDMIVNKRELQLTKFSISAEKNISEKLNVKL